MGQLDVLKNKKLYLDTNILIYLFEGEPSFELVLNKLIDMVDFEIVELITSELTVTEFFHGVIKSKGIKEAEAHLPDFIESSYFKVLPIPKNAYFKAVELRILQKLKTPDALHLATALSHKCDIFLTNDKGFKGYNGIEVVYLSDL